MTGSAINNLEDQDQEILWIKLENGRTKTHIGIFYGPQEKCSNEEAERQYAQLMAQVNKLRTQGEIILMGDFNAKLEIKRDNINQEISRNGKLLEKMIKETNTIPISTKAHKGAWTRTRKRLDNMEKSIIDYVIMSSRIAECTKFINIDEDGIFKLKGKEETDHNSILVEVEINAHKKVTKQKITNFKDKQGWKTFNEKLADKFKNNPPEDYDEYESALKEIIKASFKTITMTKGEYKYRKSDKTKTLKKEKKAAKKAFESSSPNKIHEKLQDYIQAQKDLRNELENDEKSRVEQRINLIIEKGGAGSDHFWKIRKKILSQGKNEIYDLITEDDITIKEPEKSKEYIANFYENLYKAREGTPQYQQWTNKIIEKVKDIENSKLEEEPDFTINEVKEVIKNLKRAG